MKMNKIVRTATALPALLFTAIGIRWWLEPAGAARELGMPLLEGSAMSTQIGDLSAFFISAALMIFIGLITLNKTWLQAAALLTAFAAIGRTIATVVHGADLATQSIAIEAVVTAWLIFAASQIKPADTSNYGE